MLQEVTYILKMIVKNEGQRTGSLAFREIKLFLATDEK